MAAVAAEATRPPVLEESVAGKILRVVAKAPVHLVLAFIGVLWLVPTLGLLLTSLLTPAEFETTGWWKIFSKPGSPIRS